MSKKHCYDSDYRFLKAAKESISMENKKAAREVNQLAAFSVPRAGLEPALALLRTGF
jgi:hypothetical protein